MIPSSIYSKYGWEIISSDVIEFSLSLHSLRVFAFAEQHFEKDINLQNPLGMQGRMAVVFSDLMDILWKGIESSHAPQKLRVSLTIIINSGKDPRST